MWLDQNQHYKRNIIRLPITKSGNALRQRLWEYIMNLEKTPSTESLRWYLIVSIYKLQYIWICCQFLSQLLKLIFNVIKTGVISTPSPWEELMQSCRWKSGTSWACCQSLSPLMTLIFNFIENLTDFTSIPMGIDKNLSLKSGNRLGSVHSMGEKRCKFIWMSSFWSEKSLLESNTSLWKFCWPDLTIKGLLLEKSWNFYVVSVSFFKFTHGIILVIGRWKVSRHAGQ